MAFPLSPRARGLKPPLHGLQRAIRRGFSATGPVPPSWRGGALPARALSSARPWEVAPPSMAALKKNGLAAGPAPSMAQGPSTVCCTRTKGIPAFSRGRCPRTPAIPGFCALFVRSPRRAGGLLALCALRLRRAQGFGRFAPRCAPLPPSSLRAVARLPPPALALGGRGWVPSRPCRPLPAGASAAPCGGGWVAPFVRCRLLWGCSVAPFASSVVRSARAGFAPWSGCALGVSFRPSSRAFSGFVAVVRFSSPAAAARFSRSWGARLAPSVRLIVEAGGGPRARGTAKYKPNRAASALFPAVDAPLQVQHPLAIPEPGLYGGFQPRALCLHPPGAGRQERHIRRRTGQGINKVGKHQIKARLTSNVPRDVLMMYEPGSKQHLQRPKYGG